MPGGISTSGDGSRGRPAPKGEYNETEWKVAAKVANQATKQAKKAVGSVATDSSTAWSAADSKVRNTMKGAGKAIQPKDRLIKTPPMRTNRGPL